MNFSDEGLAIFRQSRTMSDGLLALIHKGVTDAVPLCDSIKRAQKFTGKGLTPASPPDKIQTSTAAE